MRPLIGLNTSLIDLDNPLRAKAICHLNYIDAIIAVGGVPVIVPPYTDRSMLFDALNKLDGFCLIGGPDYDPRKYGGHAQPAGEVMDGRRHTFDCWLAEILLKDSHKPVLGVCGGHQLLNIALGGALVQDLASEWKPSTRQAVTLLHADQQRAGTPQSGNEYRHEVKLEAGSRISKIIGDTKVLTNSFHHQAVRPDRLGDNLSPTGWSPDGVVESIELSNIDRFVLGVQWHPERLMDEAAHRAIFQALVQATQN